MQRDLPLVLQEFESCGDLVRFDNLAAGAPVNWVHLQYQVSYKLCITSVSHCPTHRCLHPVFSIRRGMVHNVHFLRMDSN